MRYQVMVAVCTVDPEYGKRLIGYAARRGDYPFELQLFTDPSSVSAYDAGHRLAAVLLSEELYHKEDWTGFSGHLMLLSGSALPKEELDTLYFYQSAEEILAGLAAALVRLGVDDPEEYDRVQITGIFSAFAPARGRSLVMELAEELIKAHRVLLIELTAWSPLLEQLGIPGAAGVSDLFYYLRSGREGFWMKLAGRCGDAGGVKVLGGPGNPADLMQLTEKDWEEMFACLRMQNLYDRIILLLADAPVLQPVFFKGCDRIRLLRSASAGEACREEQLEAYLSRQLPAERSTHIRWIAPEEEPGERGAGYA